MTTDGKTPILLITLGALVLVYLDNAGKLATIKGIIAGAPQKTGGAQAASAGGGVYVPAGGTAPAPVTPLPASGGKVYVTLPSGQTVTIPAAPPLPSLIGGG